jgi:HK97 family phage prohead protease
MKKRTAIAVHHTATQEGEWNGPANEERLRTGEIEAHYQKAFAWQDPDGDPQTKTTYRFIHHFVGEAGEIGAASTVGCMTGIGVLNGGRGGTTIPSGDRQGIYNHLAGHLRDADIEPPDLRSGGMPVREERTIPFQEFRVERRNGDDPTIVGYAAVFDTLSVELWGFFERVKPGAFAKTIRESDVRALWNHNSDMVLGRTKSGTLRLKEDEIGLRIEVDPPGAQWARDAVVTIERGDVDQMSFGFNTIQDHWLQEDGGGGRLIRELVEVRLFDVSPVTFPAYPDTTVQVRELLGADWPTFGQALDRLERGQATAADIRILDQATLAIRSHMGKDTAAPALAGHAADSAQPETTEAAIAAAHRRRRLELQRFR